MLTIPTGAVIFFLGLASQGSSAERSPATAGVTSPKANEASGPASRVDAKSTDNGPAPPVEPGKGPDDLSFSLGELVILQGGLQRDVAALSSEIQATKESVYWFGLERIIVGLFVVLVGIIGWNAVGRLITERIDAFAQGKAKTIYEDIINTEKGRIATRIESELEQSVGFLALFYAERYADALQAWGWSGDPTSIRGEPFSFRRMIVVALSEASNSNPDFRRDAWTALEELASEDRSLQTGRLYLKLANRFQRTTDGIRYFEALAEAISSDTEIQLRAATLYRRKNNPAKTLEICLKHIDDDPEALVNAVAAQRDLGNFDEAYDLSKERVEKIVLKQATQISKSEARILGTFCATCADRSVPLDAMKAAMTLLEVQPDAVSISTLQNMVDALPISVQRAALVDAMKKAASRVKGTGGIHVKARATVSYLDGDSDGACEQIRSFLDASDRTRVSEEDEYWLRYLWGFILNRRKSFEEAKKPLLAAVQLGNHGWVEYELAICYAGSSDSKSSVAHLTNAAKLVPRWLKLASKNETLSNDPAIKEYLSQRAKESISKRT